MPVAEAIGKLKMRLGVTNLRVRSFDGRFQFDAILVAASAVAGARWVIWSSV